MSKGEHYWQGMLFASLAVAIWAGFILVSRAAGVSPLTPWDVIALRYGTAALAFLALCSWRKQWPPLNWRMFAIAMSGGLGYAALVYSGFRLAPAAHAAILLPGLMPFTIALLAAWLCAEAIHRVRAIGLALVALGVVCLGVDTFSAHALAWQGDLLMVLASCSWSLCVVLARRWGVVAWDVASGVVLISAAVFLPIYLLWLPSQISTTAVNFIALQVLYQGILASVVQMLLFFRAVSLIGPSRVGMLMALVPVIAGVAAVPILGETLSAYLLAGLLLVAAGAGLDAFHGLKIRNR